MSAVGVAAVNAEGGYLYGVAVGKHGQRAVRDSRGDGAHIGKHRRRLVGRGACGKVVVVRLAPKQAVAHRAAHGKRRVSRGGKAAHHSFKIRGANENLLIFHGSPPKSHLYM